MVCMLAAPRLCKVQNVVVMQGDSGGPLMCRDLAMRWVAVGVVSYGTQPCVPRPQAAKPTVFTRLDYYVDWIHAVMRRH